MRIWQLPNPMQSDLTYWRMEPCLPSFRRHWPSSILRVGRNERELEHPWPISSNNNAKGTNGHSSMELKIKSNIRVPYAIRPNLLEDGTDYGLVFVMFSFPKSALSSLRCTVILQRSVSCTTRSGRSADSICKSSASANRQRDQICGCCCMLNCERFLDKVSECCF